MRPADEPSVIAAGAELVARLGALNDRLAGREDALAGREGVFIGQIHAGEIYNQYPQECWLEGTRRWLPGTSRGEVEGEFRAQVGEVAARAGTAGAVEFRFIRDAFRLDDGPL